MNAADDDGVLTVQLRGRTADGDDVLVTVFIDDVMGRVTGELAYRFTDRWGAPTMLVPAEEMPTARAAPVECQRCDGQGSIVIQENYGRNADEPTTSEVCIRCNGTGEVVR